MSGESVLVAFAREGVEMVLASIAKANETEKAEIKAMLDETSAALDAIPPLAPELDAITEVHLARVRRHAVPEPAKGERVEVLAGHEWEPATVTAVSMVNGQVLVSASGVASNGAVVGPHVTSFWGDRVRVATGLHTEGTAPADLPTEGLDPDDA